MTTLNMPLRNLSLLALMFMAAALAIVLKPTRFEVDPTLQKGYEKILPEKFGDWISEENKGSLVVNPQQEEQLKGLYSEVVAKTYVQASSGRKIMLSIAYSADQRHENQIHKPEVCYPAQGFELLGIKKDSIQTRFGNIPVMRVQTRQGRRVEPVTYWIRVGDKLVRGAIEQNLARVLFGLRGRIPDGLLFRVSSIEDDTVVAYKLQDQFVDDLIGVLDPMDRSQFIGDTVSSNSASTNLSGVTRALKD